MFSSSVISYPRWCKQRMVYSSIRGAPADDGRQTQALGHKHALKTWTIKRRRETNLRKLCKRLSEKHSPPVSKYSFLASRVKLQPSWRPAEVWRCCRISVMCSCSCDSDTAKKKRSSNLIQNFPSLTLPRLLVSPTLLMQMVQQYPPCADRRGRFANGLNGNALTR